MQLKEQAKTPETITTLSRPRFAPSDSRVATTMWALAMWTYQRQKAHLGNGQVGGNGYGSISPTGAVLERLRLGVSIDCSRGGGGLAGGFGGSTCDDDAMEVHRLVLQLGKHAHLLIDAASMGAPPEWQPAYPPARTSKVVNGKGKVVMIYDHNRNAIACKLDVTGFAPGRAREWVEHHRQRYTTWWAALSVVHDALVARQPLRHWRVAGIGAQAEPWRG